MSTPIVKVVKVAKLDKSFFIELCIFILAILIIIGIGSCMSINERTVVRDMAADYSCGATDIRIFCAQYGVTPYQLQDSIVLKKNFSTFLNTGNINKLNDKVKK
jgi:hypothetical protein